MRRWKTLNLFTRFNVIPIVLSGRMTLSLIKTLKGIFKLFDITENNIIQSIWKIKNLQNECVLL